MFRGLPARCVSVAVVALAALSGCGHAGSSVSPVALSGSGAAAAVSAGVATAKLSLSIPNPAALSSTKRQVAYVSSASATVNITAAYGALTIPNNGLNVASGSPYCVASGTGRLCQLPIKAPIGPSVQFTMQILDTNADILSTSNFATPVTAAIAEGAANVLPTVVLDAVPASFSASVGAVPYNVQGGTQSTPPQVIVTALDAAGDIIAGPGNYSTSNGLTAITYAVTQYGPTSLNSVLFSASATCASPALTATWSAPSNTLYLCNSGSADIGTQLVVTESDNSAAETIPVPFTAIPISETQLSHNDWDAIPNFYIGSVSTMYPQYHTSEVGGLMSGGYAYADNLVGNTSVACTLSGAQTPASGAVDAANGNFYVIGSGSTPSVYKFPESVMDSYGSPACASTTSLAVLAGSPSAYAEDPVNQRLWIAEGSTIQVLDETVNYTTTNPILTTFAGGLGNINALAFSNTETGEMYASNYGSSKIGVFKTGNYSARYVTLDSGTSGSIVAAGPDGAVYALTQANVTNIYRVNPGYVFSLTPHLIAQYNEQVELIPESGYFSVGGDGQMWVAEGLTETIDRIDPVSGNIQVAATPQAGSLGVIATVSGNGYNRLLWVDGDYNVFTWPGVWPAF